MNGRPRIFDEAVVLPTDSPYVVDGVMYFWNRECTPEERREIGEHLRAMRPELFAVSPR